MNYAKSPQLEFVSAQLGAFFLINYTLNHSRSRLRLWLRQPAPGFVVL